MLSESVEEEIDPSDHSFTKVVGFKSCDVSFEGFSVSFVVVYSIFSVDHVFLEKFAKLESSIHFVLANFSMKTRSTEKMEYTTAQPAENPFKISSQIFFILETLSQTFFATK